MATTIIVSSMAQKARNTSKVGVNRAYSNRESGENKCGDSMYLTKGRVCTTKLIYHRSG